MIKHPLILFLFINSFLTVVAQPGWDWPKEGNFITIQIDETKEMFTHEKVIKDSIVIKVGNGRVVHGEKTKNWPLENIIIDVQLCSLDTIPIVLESSENLIKIYLVDSGVLKNHTPTRLFLKGIPKKSGTYFINLSAQFSERKHIYYLTHDSYDITPVDWNLIKHEE